VPGIRKDAVERCCERVSQVVARHF
jgi:hypothetical protein